MAKLPKTATPATEGSPVIVSSKVPKPGYMTNKPVYPAVRGLLFALGCQDTKVNLGEVAIRLFEKTFEGESDPTSIVNNACIDMKVNTSLRVPWNEVRRNGHQFSIAQVMSITDSFFRRLGYEYRLYHGIPAEKWRFKIAGEQLDSLTALLENIPKGMGDAARQCPEFALIQYYRLVRNRTIHGSDRDTGAHHDTLMKDHGNYFRDAYDSAPRSYRQISYSDFLLLTRAVKYYSRVLNQVCGLTPELILRFHVSDDQGGESGEIAWPVRETLPSLNGLRKLKGKPRKIPGVVKAFKRAYEMSAADTFEFEGIFRAFLESDDTARVRARRRAGKKRRE